MTTFNEILKKYEFTDFEDDDGPIISSMYHKDDVVKAIQEWLTEKRKEKVLLESKLCHEGYPCDATTQRIVSVAQQINFIDELLEEVAFNNRKETEESK